MIKKYCYRDVDFYEKAYMGIVFLKDEDKNLNTIYPVNTIYKDLKDLKKQFKKIKKESRNRKNDPIDIYGALIMRISFYQKSPLKKEFWETKSDIVLNNFYRVKQYLKMFKDGEGLYKIMVMPYFYNTKEKKWILANWLPVLMTTTDDELAKIAIMSSETQVDASAKNMGLYTIDWVKGFDIETGEILKPNNTYSVNDLNS